MSYCDHCDISNYSAAICRGMFLTLRSTVVWVTLWQNLGRNWLTDVSQILTRSGRHIWLSYAIEIVLISSAVWAQWDVCNCSSNQSSLIDNEKTLRNGISHWNRSSPLQQCCATAQTVIYLTSCCGRCGQLLIARALATGPRLALAAAKQYVYMQ